MAITKALAIIAGVGPGTGAAVAKRFAQEYNVVLLARSTSSLDPVVQEIQSLGGNAFGIPTDISDAKSVDEAFKQIAAKYPGTAVSAAVFNASAGLIKKPFLELSAEEWNSTWTVNGTGAFLFSQAVLPLLVASKHLAHPPTLIFTGATAGIKAFPNSATFAAGNFAKRALSQSLAKEFGPQGIHVSYAVIDGVIDIPKTKAWLNDVPDAKISPDAIANAYWHIHTQPRTAFTWEIDIRPYVEKW
ncbi:hypothetical protein Q9L58_002604 [Maublancomyces gigas]|uniref:NAD(P)-binding protein n=1 Tax=Discina gigas TaxID=1032678 RepID=A0ABR3GQW7_9PEZI